MHSQEEKHMYTRPIPHKEKNRYHLLQVYAVKKTSLFERGKYFMRRDRDKYMIHNTIIWSGFFCFEMGIEIEEKRQKMEELLCKST